MSTPLKPTWESPSHAEIQEVQFGESGFQTRSFSKVNVAPFGLFAKLTWPPCTETSVPAYSSVQFERGRHLNLNSDLMYINHSCEPSLIFNVSSFEIIVGPNGLRVGDELTYFYPSTEWHMAQPFDCLCGTPSCRGRISGAKHMDTKALEGVFLNGHIHALLEQKKALESGTQLPPNHPPAVSCHNTGNGARGCVYKLRQYGDESAPIMSVKDDGMPKDF